MKTISPKQKLVRIMAAASLGSLMWTGCASAPGPRFAATPAPTSAAIQEAILQAPIDLTNRRPDTHPHVRSGLWHTSHHISEASYSVIEAPGLDIQAPAGYADTPVMLAFSPEVRNVATLLAEPAIGEEFAEAAGAGSEAQADVLRDLEAYGEELKEKLERHMREQGQPEPAL